MEAAIEDDQGRPVLIFTRQAMAHQPRDPSKWLTSLGGYVLLAGAAQVDEIDVVIIGTGSELELAVEAANQLSDEGYHIRVVSMPSTSLFDRQDAAYRESVLPAQLFNRVAVEAAHVDFYKYAS